MFFKQKKYAEEIDKHRKKSKDEKEPSLFSSVTLGLLATFTATQWMLHLHKRKIADSSKRQAKQGDFEQVPIIYIHGFRGGDYTTNVMIRQTTKLKKNNNYLKVTVDVFGNFKLEGTWTGDEHPLVQLVFEQKIIGIYAICYLLRMSLSFLSKRYNFHHYNAVSHSLGAPCTVKTEMHTSLWKKFPRLNKCALIAGPFDGVMYLGDIPNVNRLSERGRPVLMSYSYMGMLLSRGRFNPNISVLNIYGNTLDETNTDRFISVVSAKSIRYILAPVARFYQEVEFRGKDAEHSMLHDNLMVIDTINKFLGLEKNS